MELFNNQRIPFGFNFKWNSHYFFCEIDNFGECAGNIEPLEAREKYRKFLDNLDKYSATTLVDAESYWHFIQDCDNRAQIDYREAHYEDEPNIKRGGKAFHNRFLKMNSHFKKYFPDTFSF
tara:strand:- start:119 stop:481 length:363 start_codon:yes stop_codon:yes gene_type:complete